MATRQTLLVGQRDARCGPNGLKSRDTTPDMVQAAHGILVWKASEHWTKGTVDAMLQPCRVAEAVLPTRYGPFRMLVYDTPAGKEHVALTTGPIAGGAPVLVRLHSECLTGDVFGSARCDCGQQLDDSLRVLQEEGRGILLYMRQEGRGIGLFNKIRAYALQDQGYDTVEANVRLGLPDDMREYGAAAAILHHLGVRQVRLLTNNPAKIAGLVDHGIEVVERLPLQVPPTPYNHHYLSTKREKMGHLLPSPPAAETDG